ncbi:MAG: hypothetical protein M3Q26_02510 [Acidobacteriota bacterium]|nr:hypothetical protein [Acidobacteriota bacterium]
MNFDIAIFYRDDTPEELILGLAKELRDADLNVESEQRSNEPVAAFEWVLPAVVIFIASQYAGGLAKEAAKEHYPIIKAIVSKYATKLLGIKQTTLVSSHSRNKLQASSPISSSFAIWSEALDGRSIKFLFLSDRDKDFYDNCADEAFKTLLNHAQDYPKDDILKQLEGIQMPHNEIYMVFDESLKVWKVVDNPATLLGG